MAKINRTERRDRHGQQHPGIVTEGLQQSRPTLGSVGLIGLTRKDGVGITRRIPKEVLTMLIHHGEKEWRGGSQRGDEKRERGRGKGEKGDQLRKSCEEGRKEEVCGLDE